MSTVFKAIDQNGAPLQNVLLQATSPNNGPWQAVTDADGLFDAGLGDGTYTVLPSKSGYSGVPETIEVGPVTFVMTQGGPPPHSDDAIDLSQAIITAGSPDVRGWPVTTKIQGIQLNLARDMGIDFDKRNGPNAWPFVPGPEGGDIQYTLWVGCKIGGSWYLCGSILCISRSPTDNYVPTGPTLLPGQLPNNWYYFCGQPLATYQPQPGEQVAWFVTAGVQRRNDIHVVEERSQVVLAPFSPGTYTFAF